MKRWLYGAGIALGFVVLVTAMTVTDFFGLYQTPTVVAASCPWTDNDGNDNDGTSGIYEFKVSGSPYNVTGASTDYDCTSGTTGITTFKVVSGVTINFNGDTVNGYVTSIKFTNLEVKSGGILNADGKGCAGGVSANGSGPDDDGSLTNRCDTGDSGYGAGSSGAGDGGGGRYGGTGGNGGGSTYDSATAPALFGSGGGGHMATGGNGGGAIRLDVSGTFTHNGTVRANGSDAANSPTWGAGGGSGGSIYITVGTMMAGSTGTFEAKGGLGKSGAGSGGGGGGGRIAITYSSASFSFDSTDFNVSGGATVVAGSKGTVYVKDTANNDVYIYHGFTFADSDYSVRNWTVDSSAITTGSSPDRYDNLYCDQTISSGATPSINATGTIVWNGEFYCNKTISSFTVTADTDFDMTGQDSTYGRARLNLLAGNLEFNLPASGTSTWDNAIVGVNNAAPASSIGYRFTINDAANIALTNSTQVIGNIDWTGLASLNIGSSASVSANALGCPAGTSANGYGPDDDSELTNRCDQGDSGYGVGGGGSGEAGGGRHGGTGGNGGGNTYDSPTTPALFGSGGGGYMATGGVGGGLIRIDVSGTLTNNGTIKASGGNAAASPTWSGGGGSGGSIYITTGTITNGGGTDGTFVANGGNASVGASSGGGGGGGRIAIIYNSSSFGFDKNDFSVAGGTCTTGSSYYGHVGTVYVRDMNDDDTLDEDDDVTIYHGFTFEDTDFSVHDWTIESSAITTGSSPDVSDNIYCASNISSGATPSITASGTMVWNGEFTCSKTISSFTLLASTDFDMTGQDSTYGRARINLSAGDLVFHLPTSGTSTWTDTAITTANTTAGTIGFRFSIDDAANIALSGTTDVAGNINWTNLASLNVGSTSTISANTKGCQGGASANGYGPDDDGQLTNRCDQGDSGFGTGSGGAGNGQGAGHGGTGGYGDGSGGKTYGSATAPILLGSGGGGTVGTGGIGGGLIRIDISGALTLSGTIRANGGNGAATPTWGAGGGSGGSVYVSSGPISGSGAFEAKGGNGVNGAGGGGGGGGGRVRYEYAGGSFGGTCTVTGGSGGASGNTGTCSSELTDDPPVVSSVTVTPSSPNVNQHVVISATATDDNGVNQIKIYVDSGAGYVLFKTCNFTPATSPATCSGGTVKVPFGRGVHTIKVEATDTVSNVTTDTTHTFSVAAETTDNHVALSRITANTANIFDLSFVLAGTSTGTLTVTFPTGFVLGNFGTTIPTGSCAGGGTVTSFSRVSDTVFTAAKSGCGAGTVSVSNIPITNPISPGEYIVTWTNDNGEGTLYIIDDDQVMINAEIDPSLTFDIDVATTDTSSSSPYTVSLGTLLTTQINGSDDSTIPGIWVDISTNATGGALITVLSTNEALKSASVSGDTIPSGAVSTGTEGYGLCVSTGGLGTPTATAGTLTKVSPFNGTCTTSSFTVGTLTTGAQTIFNTAGNPIDGGRAQIRAAASISSLTEAHNDYTDTLTFIATGTF